MSEMTWKPADLENENQMLKGLSAPKRIARIVERFGKNAVLLSSMQKTATVLMHMFYKQDLDNDILFVDTGYHFIETLKLRDEYLRRYRLNIITLYPVQTVEEQEVMYGRKLFNCEDGQPTCCDLRKREPFLAYLRTLDFPVVINGLRRSEGGKRQKIDPLSADPRSRGLTLSPLFDWSDETVAEYIAENRLEIHPLHEKSYPSIGCATCTTPVRPGESLRAGRWRHLREPEAEVEPAYCGINFSDGGGI